MWRAAAKAKNPPHILLILERMEKYGLEIQGYYIQAWKREGNKNVRLILASFHARSEKTKDHAILRSLPFAPT